MKNVFIFVIVFILISFIGAGLYVNKDKILGLAQPPAIEEPLEPDNKPGTEEPGETPGTEEPEEKPVSYGIKLDNDYIYF